MGIVNSLFRLERAGEENSKSNKKLRRAAREVAHVICELAPPEVTLPRGYRVEVLSSRIGRTPYLRKNGEYLDVDVEGYLHRDLSAAYLTFPSRETVLEFSKDIAEGLLDEIALFVEQRTKEEEEASRKLEAALEAQQKAS